MTEMRKNPAENCSVGDGETTETEPFLLNLAETRFTIWRAVQGAEC